MKYIFDTLEFHIEEECVVSLGKFDGLHTGHKLLIDELEKGSREGLKSAVVTFDILPISLQQPAVKVLNTREEKRIIFEKIGVDYFIELPFVEELKNKSPYEFLEWLTERIRVKRIVCGTDFRFGHNRLGNCEVLEEYQKDFHYELRVFEKLQYRHEDISSTRIRNLVAVGQLSEANDLLGYHYFIKSKVVHGKALGRTIGIPTANQEPPHEKLLPPFGVYVSEILIDDIVYYGISNIGKKPTVGDSHPVGVETFIFQFDQDIYGKEITVSLLEFIRKEQKFQSLDDLIAQMNRDIATCKDYLKEKGLQSI